MARSVVTYVADGSTDEFDVTFPYISRNHVSIKVNNTDQVLPPRWVSDSRIKLSFLPPNGSVVEIRRRTPLDTRLVDFQNGSVLTEEELDKAINQVFYVQQELTDLYDAGLGKALIKVAQNGGITTFDPETLLDELIQEILSRNVVLDLRQRIADINLNAETILKQANRIDALQGVVDQLTGGVEETEGLATFLIQERDQRIAGDTAILSTLSLMGAKSADGTAWILDTSKVKLSPTESFVNRLEAITARQDATDAQLVSEKTALATDIAAQASRVDTLYTRMGAAESGLVQESSTRASAIQAEATKREALAARVTTNEAAIQQEANTRASADQSLASTLAILGAKTANGTAFALDETKVLVGGGIALGTRLTGIDTKINNNTAAIAAESKARADAIAAEASLRQGLQAQVDQAKADIVTEAQTRATAIGALSQTISLLGAQNASATAFVLDMNKVLVAPGQSLGQRFEAITASVSAADARITTTNNTIAANYGALSQRIDNVVASLSGVNNDLLARISNETNARVMLGNSLASQLSTVQTSVNGVSSSVSVLQQSVNGMASRFAVRIDSGLNAVAGIELVGGGSVLSTFRVVANLFELVTPGTTFRPFYVENGVTYIENAVIRNGAVTDIGTYFGNLNGRRITGSYWTWYDLTDQWGSAVSATVNAGGASGARAVIDFTWVASRDGGDDDNLGLRIVRSDGVVLSQQLDNVQIGSGKRTYSAKFYDPSVPTSYPVSYRVQFQSQGDGFSYWYNVALVATLHKK
jgi:hypothetical protein